MTEVGNPQRINGPPPDQQQLPFRRLPLSPSPDAPEWKPGGLRRRSTQGETLMEYSAQKRLSIDTGCTDFDYLARSPLLEHELPPGPSGLPRIRQQPQHRALSHPAASRTPSVASTSTPTSATLATSAISIGTASGIEDLHRFPSESLHSFSFAQQSAELLHSRHNALKRSLNLMKSQLGGATSGGGAGVDAGGGDGPHNALARVGDVDIQRAMADLMSRADFLSGGADHPSHIQAGPVTGPALATRENVFDTAFGDYPTASPTSYNAVDPLTNGEPAMAPPPDQLLDPNRAMTQTRALRSAPASRRASLRRTYTDLSAARFQNRLMDALSQPHTTSGFISPSAGASTPVVHTHSSKWSPVPQAVFRTEAKPRWTILATNDLACLVFGITQKEFRKLSILDLIQPERRSWLESKLRSSHMPSEPPPPPEQQSPRKTKLPSRFPGIGNGVTAQLLSKPPAREQLARRSQTTDSYDKARRSKSPHHSPTKSRGVLLCGDVVPIQKRSGSTGSASLWVIEKKGGLIWVVEEIIENQAQLQFDAKGNLIQAQGDFESIWGKRNMSPLTTSIFDLLPHAPKQSLIITNPDSPKPGSLKHFTARISSGVEIPVTVEPTSAPFEFRISSFPHIAGMIVVSSQTLEIISANPVFSAALFGHSHRPGSKITDLIPGFDTFLEILIEEDDLLLVDGMVIPEHSFRRARALSILRQNDVDLAALFSQPTGLPARHRDGGEIMVDIQMRVVKSETFFPRDQMPTLGENEELRNARKQESVPVTEVVFALWVTYARPLHLGVQDAAPQTPLPQPHFEPSSPPSMVPDLQTSNIKNNNNVHPTPEAQSANLSVLSQQLSEAASEPLTDKPVQLMPEVKSPANNKREPPKKKTINDYVILEDMGQGAYGQVKLARSKRDPTKKVVLKYVTKKRILVDTWTRDRRLGTVPLEIHVLDYLRRDHLRHPNIVEMEGFFEDDMNYYIEMTPHGLPGMDLFDYVELRANMTESECRNIFRQVVDAIHHLHTKALVAHRDIKDENVILDGEGRIKLIDFGSAAYLKNGPFDVFVGTIDYAAPEVLQGKQYRGKEQDVWALGILLYTIIYKENPFYNINEIMDHPLRIPFLPFSEDCIDLIRKMLDRDVDQRLEITDVIKHPWLQGSTSGTGSSG